MTFMECLVCYEEKEKEMFIEKPIVDSSTTSLLDSLCIHLTKTCKKCFSSLQKPECPYCRQDWSVYYDYDRVMNIDMEIDMEIDTPSLQRHTLPFIFENIYLWIAICEDDIALIHHLLETWNVDITLERPFVEISYLITGKDGENNISDAFDWWNQNPQRSIMKETFLQCNQIQYQHSTNNYVCSHS